MGALDASVAAGCFRPVAVVSHLHFQALQDSHPAPIAFGDSEWLKYIGKSNGLGLRRAVCWGLAL